MSIYCEYSRYLQIFTLLLLLMYKNPQVSCKPGDNSSNLKNKLKPLNGKLYIFIDDFVRF